MLHKRARRFAGAASLGAGMLSTAAAAALCAAHPAAAAAAVAAIQSAISCATTGTTPCVSGTNTSSGIGVLGASNTGTGIRGTSNTNNGVKGSSKTNYGILGQSTSGYGVGGSSPNVGLVGSASGFNIGVWGQTDAASDRLGAVGVVGHATGTGVAIRGFSDSGIGVWADSFTGVGLAASSGIHAVSSSTSVTGANPAVDAFTDSQGSIAFEAHTPSTGFPLILGNSSGQDVFIVDGTGNVRIGGTLTSFARTAGGATATAFSPQTTVPTVEDTGTSQLVGGLAAVRLDPAFAASIDARIGYRVFLTPRADTSGLFIATKTASGFVVRESQGGRTTMSFDYRILATARGGAGQRMAVTRFAMPQTALPVVSPLNAPRPPVAPTIP